MRSSRHVGRVQRRVRICGLFYAVALQRLSRPAPAKRSTAGGQRHEGKPPENSGRFITGRPVGSKKAAGGGAAQPDSYR